MKRKPAARKRSEGLTPEDIVPITKRQRDKWFPVAELEARPSIQNRITLKQKVHYETRKGRTIRPGRNRHDIVAAGAHKTFQDCINRSVRRNYLSAKRDERGRITHVRYLRDPGPNPRISLGVSYAQLRAALTTAEWLSVEKLGIRISRLVRWENAVPWHNRRQRNMGGPVLEGDTPENRAKALAVFLKFSLFYLCRDHGVQRTRRGGRWCYRLPPAEGTRPPKPR